MMYKEPFSFYNQKAMSLAMLHRLRAEQAPPEPKGPTEEALEAERILREEPEGEQLLMNIHKHFINALKKYPLQSDWGIIANVKADTRPMCIMIGALTRSALVQILEERYPDFDVEITVWRSYYHVKRHHHVNREGKRVIEVTRKFTRASIAIVFREKGGAPAVGTPFQGGAPAVGTPFQGGAPAVGTPFQGGAPPVYEELE